MGEPAIPTTEERAKRRTLARDIVDSVRNDERMPLRVGYETDGAGFHRTSVEELAFALAQELDMLRDELVAVDSAIGDWDWARLYADAERGLSETSDLVAPLACAARIEAARREARGV